MILRGHEKRSLGFMEDLLLLFFFNVFYVKCCICHVNHLIEMEDFLENRRLEDVFINQFSLTVP
jgi:hypothetical protein